MKYYTGPNPERREPVPLHQLEIQELRLREKMRKIIIFDKPKPEIPNKLELTVPFDNQLKNKEDFRDPPEDLISIQPEPLNQSKLIRSDYNLSSSKTKSSSYLTTSEIRGLASNIKKN